MSDTASFEAEKAVRPRRRRGPLAVAALFVAAVYGFLVVPAVRQTWPELSWPRSQRARTRPPRNYVRFAPVQQTLPRLGTFTPDGPMLTEGNGASLGIQEQQLLPVNAILKVSFQEYLQLERQHWTQERSETGRLVTTIAPFPADFEQLENHFWSKLSLLLDEQQQSRVRNSLPLRPPPADSLTAGKDRVAPGWLGWAGEALRIETWRADDEYQWTISVRDQTETQSSPTIPHELARFWDAQL
jgi:hypothetical protein